MMSSNSSAFGTKPTGLMVVVQWLFRYSHPARALASQATHWRYDTEDVLQLTLTRMAITYILNFAAAATTSRIATRWQLQKRGYYCGSVCPGFASCTERQEHPLGLGAPARHCKYTRKKLSSIIDILLRSWHQLHFAPAVLIVVV